MGDEEDREAKFFPQHGNLVQDILLHHQIGVAVVDQRGQPAVASQNEGLIL